MTTPPAPGNRAAPTDHDSALAARVFTLAAAAPPRDWHDCDGGARIVVNTAEHRYVVIVPTGRDDTGQPRPAYIENRLLPRPGGHVAPFGRVHADAPTTAALAAAHRHARDLRDRAADTRPTHP
ncbi:hypothetical protein ACFXHA_45525 [Nocardia sp. NPDC059240]|uniref:hypothetical protein n=1 Tax=Nocardia sp. NPDC059240 TaxID=3346786 RepID=UPI00367426F3